MVVIALRAIDRGEQKFSALSSELAQRVSILALQEIDVPRRINRSRQCSSANGASGDGEISARSARVKCFRPVLLLRVTRERKYIALRKSTGHIPGSGVTMDNLADFATGKFIAISMHFIEASERESRRLCKRGCDRVSKIRSLARGKVLGR